MSLAQCDFDTDLTFDPLQAANPAIAERCHSSTTNTAAAAGDHTAAGVCPGSAERDAPRDAAALHARHPAAKAGLHAEERAGVAAETGQQPGEADVAPAPAADAVDAATANDGATAPDGRHGAGAAAGELGDV